MSIVPQSARNFCTPPPAPVSVSASVLMLPAPKPRLMLSAPKIAGYLPMPTNCTAGGYMDSPLQHDTRIQVGRHTAQPLPVHHRASHFVPVKRENTVKRVVVAEIVNPIELIDFRRDPDAWWEEFERMYPSQTIEELDAEIEAKHPGWIKLKESWS